MKLSNILLACALCAPTIPAMADSVLLDFNTLPSSANFVAASDIYAGQGFHFSDSAYVIRSNKSGNTDNSGGFYTPYPTGGSNSNTGALAIIPAVPTEGPSSFTVNVDQGFGSYFKALAGVAQQSDVLIEAFDKDHRSLGQQALNVADGTAGCDAQMVCNWSALSLDLGDMTAYSVTITGMSSFAWFDDFEFGSVADAGPENGVPEPTSLLLAASAFAALAWARRSPR